MSNAMDPLMSDDVLLTDEHFEKLTMFVGGGSFDTSPILYFGNEEGTGGQPLQACIDWRMSLAEHGAGYINGRDWTQGYWLDERKEEAPTNDVFMSHWHDQNPNRRIPRQRTYYSPFCGYCDKFAKRVVRVEPSNGIGDEHGPTNYPWRWALSDWRPLPRASQSEWKYDTGAFDAGEFFRAFAFDPRVRDTRAIELRERRLDLITAVIRQFDFRVLVCIGEVPTKRHVVTAIGRRLTGGDPEFGVIDITPAGKQARYALRTDLRVNDRRLPVLLTPFWGNGQVVGEAFENLVRYAEHEPLIGGSFV